ncbi:MAG: flagellar motor protein MotA [Marmoricola sp.]|nr:flagellar motor protein MotA [Marmoricola sp.]
MKQHHHQGRVGERRPRSTRTAGLALFAALVLALSACASGTSSSNSGSSGSGDTIKVMTWAPLKSQLTNYPAITAAATTYGKYINAKGGINGKKLQVLTCDEGGTPNKASDCARKAIQEKVVAVISSFGYTGDATIPLLKSANIAMFGGCCSNAVADLTSSNSFIMGNGPAYGAALVQHAVDDGKKKIALVAIDGAQSYLVPAENALKANGLTPNKTVILPATAQDLSPQASQALADGTDAVVMFVNADSIKTFITAYKQIGSTARIYGPQGNLTEDVVSGFGNLSDGWVTGNSYADITSPAYADFRDALKKYNAPDMGYNGLDGLGAWAGYTAFADIVKGIDGAVTSKSFLDAASKASNVDTNGMTAPVDFTTEWSDGPKGYQRLFNRTATFGTFKDGKLSPETDKFVDYTNLMLGKPLS